MANDYPRAIAREELGRRTGYSPESGGFAKALGRLRALGLVEDFRASEALMEQPW